MSDLLVPIAISSQLDESGEERIHAAPANPKVNSDIPLSVVGDLPDALITTSGTYKYRALGGVPPFTFSLDSGSLPDGATLADDGTVTYDYSVSDVFNWTVQVEDSLGTDATLDDTATISGVACGTTTPYSGGEVYPTSFDIVLGEEKGEVTVTWGFGIPDKLEVWIGGILRFTTGYQGVGSGHTYSQDQDALDTALDGYSEPRQTLIYPETSPQTFYKSSNDMTAEARVYGPIPGTGWTFNVGCPDTSVTSGTLSISGVNRKPKVGYTKDYAYATHGGTEPYTFTVQSGALPTGRSINATTGVETGTYSAAGTYTFTVRVTDAIGATADFSDTVDVVTSF